MPQSPASDQENDGNASDSSIRLKIKKSVRNLRTRFSPTDKNKKKFRKIKSTAQISGPVHVQRIGSTSDDEPASPYLSSGSDDTPKTPTPSSPTKSKLKEKNRSRRFFISYFFWPIFKSPKLAISCPSNFSPDVIPTNPACNFCPSPLSTSPPTFPRFMPAPSSSTPTCTIQRSPICNTPNHRTPLQTRRNGRKNPLQIKKPSWLSRSRSRPRAYRLRRCASFYYPSRHWENRLEDSDAEGEGDGDCDEEGHEYGIGDWKGDDEDGLQSCEGGGDVETGWGGIEISLCESDSEWGTGSFSYHFQSASSSSYVYFG
ncbi:hypothetical protein ABW19_dt0207459 [Dactylella cylindrospora]|nr:hypothetical protein ABW19_dt0207459 [Dactylella cylindrospora]